MHGVAAGDTLQTGATSSRFRPHPFRLLRSPAARDWVGFDSRRRENYECFGLALVVSLLDVGIGYGCMDVVQQYMP
jgi:hypothetical protein